MIVAASNPQTTAPMRPFQLAAPSGNGATSASPHPQASQYGASALVVERQSGHSFVIIRLSPSVQLEGIPQK
jgi:hypothetical protein